MAEIAVLAALLLWGMCLAVGYQLLLMLLSRIAFAPFRVLVYGIGAVLCFGGTSIYLYLINGGDWGLYGFLATTAGFVLYYRRFWGIGERVLNQGSGGLKKTGSGLKTAGNFGINLCTKPFAAAIKKGEEWLSQWDEKRHREEAVENDIAEQIPPDEVDETEVS